MPRGLIFKALCLLKWSSVSGYLTVSELLGLAPTAVGIWSLRSEKNNLPSLVRYSGKPPLSHSYGTANRISNVGFSRFFTVHCFRCLPEHEFDSEVDIIR